MPGSLHQNPVVPLLQDVFVRISASAASRATCARSVYENFLCKMSVSASPQQDPVGALAQDQCMRISCARCLCQDLLGSCRSTCARSVYEDFLRKMSLSRSLYADLLCVSLCEDLCNRILYDHSVCGSLAQDLCVRIFASRSCRCMRISCARCSRSPEENPAGALLQDRCMRIFCVRCLCQNLLGSCRSTCARSLSADLLCKISLS